MMDLKDIIKWFIPCFHILLINKKLKRYKNVHVTFICLFLFLNSCTANEAKDISVSDLIANNNSLEQNTKYLITKNNSQERNFPIMANMILNESSNGRNLGKYVDMFLLLLLKMTTSSIGGIISCIRYPRELVFKS